MFGRKFFSVWRTHIGLRCHSFVGTVALMLLVMWATTVVADVAKAQGTVPSLVQSFSAESFAQMPRCSDPIWKQQLDGYKEQLQRAARFIESVSDDIVELRGEGVDLSYDRGSLSLLHRAEQAALKFARGSNVGIDSVARYRDDLEALDSVFRDVAQRASAGGGLVASGEAVMAGIVVAYYVNVRNQAFKCQEERGVSSDNRTERRDSSSRQVDPPSADVSSLVGSFRRTTAGGGTGSDTGQTDERDSHFLENSGSGETSGVGSLVGQFRPKPKPSDSHSTGSDSGSTLATGSNPEERLAVVGDQAGDGKSIANSPTSEDAFEWVSDREVNRVKACVTGGRAKDSAGNFKSNPLDGSPLITFVWNCSEKVELRWRCKGRQYADGKWEGTTSNRTPDGGHFQGRGGWNHSSCEPDPDYSGIEYAVCPEEMLQSIVWYGNGHYGCRRYRHRPK